MATQKRNEKPSKDGETNSQGSFEPIQTEIPKEFISLQEAFNLIGVHKFGDDWIEASEFDKSDDDQHLVYKVLVQAMQSYENSIFYEPINSYPREFDPIQAAGEFFRIDLEKNTAYFAIFDEGNQVTIGINRSKFLIWLRSISGAPPKQTVSARAQCVKWLETMMRLSPVPLRNKTEFKDHARAKFPSLSDNQFKDAWGEVVAREEFSSWGKSGRKPNP